MSEAKDKGGKVIKAVVGDSVTKGGSYSPVGPSASTPELKPAPKPPNKSKE